MVILTHTIKRLTYHRYLLAVLIGSGLCWSTALLIDELSPASFSWNDIGLWTYTYQVKFVYAGMLSAFLLFVFDRSQKPLTGKNLVVFICLCIIGALLLFAALLLIYFLALFTQFWTVNGTSGLRFSN
jgi:hypothetical protein